MLGSALFINILWTTMLTEIELKYSIFDRQLLPESQVTSIINQVLIEHGISFTYQDKALSNHYFDTQDLQLRKQRIALRTRGTGIENKPVCFEQTIKTSGRVIAGLHQRPEYNVDINDSKPILALFPSSLWQSDTDLVALQQQVVEMFSTNFTRCTWLITLDDAKVELAFDCGEVACEGYDNKPGIYEVELELVTGETQVLFSLTKLLLAKLPLRPGQLTKAARGYALRKEFDKRNSSSSSSDSRSTTKVSEQTDAVIEENTHSALSLEECIKHIQLNVDGFVVTESLKAIRSIHLLLQQVNKTIKANYQSDKLKNTSAELEYFIVFFNDSLTNSSVKQGETLTVLHSERFNLLQLNLLVLLLGD